jgi:hypothetical protein
LNNLLRRFSILLEKFYWSVHTETKMISGTMPTSLKTRWGLTIAPGQGMAPPAVSLTDGPVGRTLERHSLLTSKRHDGVQRRSRTFQPTVGKNAGRSAIDFWKEKNKFCWLSFLCLLYSKVILKCIHLRQRLHD